MRWLVLLIVVALLAACAEAPDAGRYQLVEASLPPGEVVVLKLDTVTGQTWELLVNDAGEKVWEPLKR